MTTTDLALQAQPLSEFTRSFQDWLARHRGEVEPLLDVGSSFDDRVQAARGLRHLLWTSGWGRFGWAEQVGGLGGTSLHRAVVTEELFRLGWTGPTIFEHLEIIAPTIVKTCHAGVRRRCHPRLPRRQPGVGPGLLRAGGGLGPRVPPHPGRTRRRRARHQRRQDLDHLGDLCTVVPGAGPDRDAGAAPSRADHGRSGAGRPRRCRLADPAGKRHQRARRGVVHGCARPPRTDRRHDRRWLAGGHVPAGARAGDALVAAALRIPEPVAGDLVGPARRPGPAARRRRPADRGCPGCRCHAAGSRSVRRGARSPRRIQQAAHDPH